MANEMNPPIVQKYIKHTENPAVAFGGVGIPADFGTVCIVDVGVIANIYIKIGALHTDWIWIRAYDTVAFDMDEEDIIIDIICGLSSTEKGIPGGIATLDMTGHLTPSQIPTSLLGAITRTLDVDKNRSDVYTENGSTTYPYKTIQAAINYIATVAVAGQDWCIRIATGQYQENLLLENVNLHMITLEGIGVVGINPVAGNSLRSTVNNGNLVKFHARNIEFTRPVVITGANGTTAFGDVWFSDCKLVTAATLTANCVNNISFSQLYIETAVTLTNVTWFFAASGQLQGAINITCDSTLPAPSGGASGTNMFDGIYGTGAVTLTKGGVATGVVVLIGSRLNSSAGTIINPAGWTVQLYGAHLRGNFTNNGTLNLRTGFIEKVLTNNATMTLDQPSSQIKNDSSVVGVTAKDALNTLQTGKANLDGGRLIRTEVKSWKWWDIVPNDGSVLPIAAPRAYYPAVIYNDTAIFNDGTSLRKCVAYYGGGAGGEAYVAFSDDGVTFDHETLVTGLVGAGYHAAIILVGTVLHYFYWDTTGSIYRPQSTRHATFNYGVSCVAAVTDAPLTGTYTTGIAGDLRYGNYGPNQVFYNAAPTNNPANPYTYQWCMIHSGTTGSIEGVLFATSSDGLNFSAWNGLTEVIPRGVAPAWDIMVGRMNVFQNSAGLWHAFYSGGLGTAGGEDTNFGSGIGYATSIDGITWVKLSTPSVNPIMWKNEAFKSWKRCYTPWIVHNSCGYHLYYSVKSNAGLYKVAMACFDGYI